MNFNNKKELKIRLFIVNSSFFQLDNEFCIMCFFYLMYSLCE
ncbi:hypothetical protein EC5905_4708 [Escherichia coli 5905]|nr:hypothetical protein EC5905_4708 [Escherichia coli 5905]